MRRGRLGQKLARGREGPGGTEGRAWREGPRSRGREGGLGGREGGSLGGSPGMEGRGGAVMDIRFAFWIPMDSIAKLDIQSNFGYP